MGGPSGAGHLDYQSLIDSLGTQLTQLNDKVKAMQAKGAKDGVDLTEMMQLQIMSNSFSQVAEAITGMFSAQNTTLMSMARGVKG